MWFCRYPCNPYLCHMKVIGNVLVPEELKTDYFGCDVPRCLGACCVEGDAGAPVTEEEISQLEDYTEQLLPLLDPEGRKVIEENGMFDWDAEGSYVTPLVDDAACAFARFTDDEIAYCAIEMAYEQGVIPFRKPVSCHLYPLRLQSLDNGMQKLNYHRWHICTPAVVKGAAQKILMSRFLDDALSRQFGAEWMILFREWIKE